MGEVSQIYESILNVKMEIMDVRYIYRNHRFEMGVEGGGEEGGRVNII